MYGKLFFECQTLNFTQTMFLAFVWAIHVSLYTIVYVCICLVWYELTTVQVYVYGHAFCWCFGAVCQSFARLLCVYVYNVHSVGFYNRHSPTFIVPKCYSWNYSISKRYFPTHCEFTKSVDILALFIFPFIPKSYRKFRLSLKIYSNQNFKMHTFTSFLLNPLTLQRYIFLFFSTFRTFHLTFGFLFFFFLLRIHNTRISCILTVFKNSQSN